MPRDNPTPPTSAAERFARHDTGFNEQLYEAMKKTPWWMISIVVHLVAYLLLANLEFQAGAGLAGSGTQLNLPPPAPELEPEEEKDELEDIKPEEEPPVPIPDAEVADHVETDNDLPFEESFGETGMSDAPFEGPSTNSLIGLGGGAGGAFKGRGGRRNLTVGGKRAHDAVELGLEWLKNHQSEDGSWDCDGFDALCPTDDRCEGLGKPLYDPGVSGLALLAFLGAGYTHRGQHPYAQTVSKGLRYLRNTQDPEGAFGSRSVGQALSYNHSCAALAMVEAFAMTESQVLREPAQKALDFIRDARNPYYAWRYGVKPGDNDTSVSGWMMMALKSATYTNGALTIDEGAWEGLTRWLDKVTDVEYGSVGYVAKGGGPARPEDLQDRFPADKSESMTAVGTLARIFMHQYKDPATQTLIQKGADLMVQKPPKWEPTDGSIDQYYWYYGTLAMYQVGGFPGGKVKWDKWNEAMEKAIIDTQRKDGHRKGSWDPADPWGREGGRVYSTALMVMCLEVYYRYDRVFGTR